jgi:hypothetical protein
MAMAGLNAGGNEARERLMLEKMGHEGERLVEQAETMKPQGCDRMASGHNPQCWVLLRRLVDDLGAPEFCKPPCDKAQGI